MSIRLSLAVETGGYDVPSEGKIAVVVPQAGTALDALPKDRVMIVQPFRPDHAYYEEQGYACVAEWPADLTCAASVVFLPRSKVQARQLVALASARSAGPVLVDGAKTDGIDSILKDLRKMADPSTPLSKAHGKVFWFSGGADLSAWHAGPAPVEGGFETAPGVFSADGIDPASRMLAEALPQKLGSRVADLGAGWGYLSARVLERETVKTLHLVEADHVALSCARKNVTDDRAEFHWEDARLWKAPDRFDAVVTNPPFHTGRAAEPSLGQAFIVAAAGMLTPSGSLWLVANRHLPYETHLSELFAKVDEITGDNRFKVLQASRPKRQRRG